jgi:hypothetical protein
LERLRGLGGLAGIESIFNTDLVKGLDFTNAADLAQRTKKYGDNKPITKPPKTFL